MARAVLVTLADEGFLDPARQVFAAAHFDAGWRGDLLLLAHEVPEERLAPFLERGILVEPCRAWHRAPSDGHFHPETVLSKFYLFSAVFRRWENVVYVDGDVMLWSSLDLLSRVRGLRAVSERRPLAGQYSRRHARPERARELEARFDLRREAFNSGLLAFESGVIEDDTFERLQEQYRRYAELQSHPLGDQPALNLHFYERWRRLPDFYGAIRDHSARHFFLPEEKLRLIGQHFAGWPRPWDPAHPRYSEWCRSLERFDALDARAKRPPRERWSALRVGGYWAWLHARRASFVALGRLRAGRQSLRRTRPARRARWLARKIRAVFPG